MKKTFLLLIVILAAQTMIFGQKKLNERYSFPEIMQKWEPKIVAGKKANPNYKAIEPPVFSDSSIKEDAVLYTPNKIYLSEGQQKEIANAFNNIQSGYVDGKVKDVFNFEILGLLSDTEQQSFYQDAKMLCQRPNCEDTLVSQQAFKQILKEDFAFVATGLASNSLRNQASLGLNKEGTELDLNIMLSTKKEEPTCLLGSVGIKAGIDNNVSSLITNDKLNTNVALALRLHINLRKALNIGYGYDYTDKFAESFQKKTELLDKQISLEEAESKLKRKKIDRDIANLNDLIRINSSDEIKKESLEIQIAKLKIQVDSLKIVMKQLPQKRSEKILALEKTAEWSKRGFTWLTLFADGNSKELKMIDTSLIFKNGAESAVSKKIYDGYKLGISLNNYLFKSSKGALMSYFFTVSFAYSKNYDIENINKFELVEKQDFLNPNNSQIKIENKNNNQTTTYTGATTNQNTITRKYDVYQGIAPQVSDRILTFQYIPFLDKDKNFAADIKYEFVNRKISDEFKNYHNLKTGLFFVAQNKANEKAKFNVELFAEFKDLTNLNENITRTKWFQRYSIGLQLGFPIGAFRK